jgi:hypothetical protein
MPTGFYQSSKQPVRCRHRLPLVFQFCDRCHIGYTCCTTCMHRRVCDVCTQQQAAAAGTGGDRREGGGK